MLRTPAFILSSTITIAVAAGGVVAIDAWRADDPHAGRTSRAFQRLTRGIGGGSAVDLAGCPLCFDPRLASVCPNRYAPLPGGDVFCAERSVATFAWPSTSQRDSTNRHAADGHDSEPVDSVRGGSGRVNSVHIEPARGDSEADDADPR